MNWHSVPPPGGPSFNQMLVLFLIAAIVVVGTLIMFEPKLRQAQQPSTKSQEVQP